MKKEQRVKITRTTTQWDRIEQNLQLIGRKNMQAHITRELLKIDVLCNTVAPVSDCTNCREQKIFWLNDANLEILARITVKTGITDPSTIVSQLIITPLLLVD